MKIYQTSGVRNNSKMMRITTLLICMTMAEMPFAMPPPSNQDNKLEEEVVIEISLSKNEEITSSQAIKQGLTSEENVSPETYHSSSSLLNLSPQKTTEIKTVSPQHIAVLFTNEINYQDAAKILYLDPIEDIEQIITSLLEVHLGLEMDGNLSEETSSEPGSINNRLAIVQQHLFNIYNREFLDDLFYPSDFNHLEDKFERILRYDARAIIEFLEMGAYFSSNKDGIENPANIAILNAFGLYRENELIDEKE